MKPEPLPATAVSVPPGPAPRRIRSEDLLGDRREIEIVHAGERYALRRTRNDKLILTK